MDKVCVNHPESPSVGTCKACEKPVCLMCIVEVQGVSFCSEACGSAYQEVKDWLERPAAEEEWNPLADTKGRKEPAAPPVAQASAPPQPAKGSPSSADMRNALSTAFGDSPSEASEPLPPMPAPKPSSQGAHPSLYIAVAATVLVIIGLVVMFNMGGGETPTPKPEIAKVDPPKVEPPKPEVKPEPPKPEVKPEPPKPEVKPEPPKPKPEPEVKPEPPKPVVKPELPKPEVKPEPPKPKPEPVVKPEPPKPVVKPELPKPEVKPEPPKPKPEPEVKPEPPKPVVKPELPKPEVKPEPPKPKPEPVVKPEPPPAPHLAFLRDPWSVEKPGAWYRIKTVANGVESYRDVGLRESGAGYRVLVSQSSVAGKNEPEQFIWVEPEDVVTLGSVNGDAQGTKYAADVVRLRASRPSHYVFKSAPHAGASFPSDAVLTKLDLQTIKVKDRSFSCTVMETEQATPKRALKTWYSTELPLGALKTEGEGSVSVLVDFGKDWAQRPPFPEPPVIAKVDPPKPELPKPEPPKPPLPKPEIPKPEPPKPEVPKPEPPKPEVPKPEPPKPEPPKPEVPKPEVAKPQPPKEDPSARVKKSLADAAVLIREATPIYQEVAGAMDSLPSDKTALEELALKAEKVQLKLSDARILYSSIKPEAPDPASLDRRMAQLDDLLASLQQCMTRLKKR